MNGMDGEQGGTFDGISLSILCASQRTPWLRWLATSSIDRDGESARNVQLPWTTMLNPGTNTYLSLSAVPRCRVGGVTGA